jgi:integrase
MYIGETLEKFRKAGRMARTVQDANLGSRAARAKLKARKKPYYRTIDQGRHLGYYKGARGGAWLARYFKGAGQYAETKLGTADDVTDADGVEILDFTAAQEKARAWFAEQARTAAGLDPKPAGPYTVADAMRDYIADYKRRGHGLRTVESANTAHILPALSSIEVAKLTTARIRAWLHGIAEAPALVRTKHGKARQHRAAPKDADGRRRRRAAANRIFNVLQAALNFAWREGKAPSDDAWRKVERFKAVDAPVLRYLTEAEWVRLVNACPADFRQLVRAALLTGCRYSELTALHGADFNPDAGTLLVRASKSGKSRHVVLTEEGQKFFAAVTAGRAGDALFFTRTDGRPWQPSDQQRPFRDACKAAKIAPAVTFHILRHTHGSTLAMRGVPLPVIAKQLGHADTRMTERHYAHLSPNYIAETIRASFPTLGILEQSNVSVLKPRAR